MMDFLAWSLVGKPLNILLVAGLFMALHLLIRSSSRDRERRRTPSPVASLAWGSYAAWEWLIQGRTPEANIRMDLLAIVSSWAIVASRRSEKT